MNVDLALKALGNRHRRLMLLWLKRPADHFSPPLDEHKGLAGACATYIFEKSELSQPTVTQYLQLLEQAGLVNRERHGQWTFFSRNEKGIQSALAAIAASIGAKRDG